MNFIFVLPRSSPRPSWSVTRTFCSLSEGWGGAVDDAGCGNFKPIKKKKKRVQPREVDVCLCAQDMEGNVKYLIALFSLPSSTPPIVQTVTWSLPSPPSCGSSRCGMPGIARDRAVANLLMTSLPKSVARSKNASARVSERKSLCVNCSFLPAAAGLHVAVFGLIFFFSKRNQKRPWGCPRDLKFGG